MDESLTDPIVLADESAEERKQHATPNDNDVPCGVHGFTRCLVCRVTAQYQAPETRGGVCSQLTFWFVLAFVCLVCLGVRARVAGEGGGDKFRSGWAREPKPQSCC